jgi:hypothetical protein
MGKEIEQLGVTGTLQIGSNLGLHIGDIMISRGIPYSLP